MTKLAELFELTALIRETELSTFISKWKPLIDFLCDTERNELMICNSDDKERGKVYRKMRHLF